MTTGQNTNHTSPQFPEPFTCSEALTSAELTVMTLIHLDPKLLYPNHREQLRLLAKLFDERFRNGQIGKAVTQLRGYFNSNPSRLQSGAFSWPPSEQPPELQHAQKTLIDLSRHLAKHTDTKTKMSGSRLIAGLRLLGHQVTAVEAQVALAACSANSDTANSLIQQIDRVKL